MRKKLTEGYDVLPSESLLNESFNVWEVAAVREGWKTILSYDSIYLLLSTLQHLRITGHC